VSSLETIERDWGREMFYAGRGDTFVILDVVDDVPTTRIRG